MKLPFFILALLLLSSCNPTSSSSNFGKSTEAKVVVSEPTSTVIVTSTAEPKIDNRIFDFALSPDGENLAIYVNTGVYVYNVKTLEFIKFEEFGSKKHPSDFDPMHSSGAIAFDPTGTELAISGTLSDQVITIWNWKTQTYLKYVSDFPNGNYVTELEYSPDGNALLVRSVYPMSMLRCETPEDTLTLVSLIPQGIFQIKKLFEVQSCNYSPIEFHFTDSNELFFTQQTELHDYWIYNVDVHSGDILQFSEYIGNTNTNGIIYDISQNGKVFAVSKYSTEEHLSRTKLLDSNTKNILASINGQVILLQDETLFLVYTWNNQWQLWKGNEAVCGFQGLNIAPYYWKVSRNKNVAAVSISDNSIQIWDIPNCKLINTVLGN